MASAGGPTSSTQVCTRPQILEAKTSPQRTLVTIPLTDDEREVLDDGGDAVEHLLELFTKRGHLS